MPFAMGAQARERPGPKVDAIRSERHKIVQLYERMGRAHIERDADAFVSAYDTAWTVITNGTIARRRKERARAELREYLAATRFSEVSEIRPPVIHIDPAGRSARFMGWVRVRGQTADSSGVPRPFAFEAAWLDVLERKGDRWVITVHANTERALAPR